MHARLTAVPILRAQSSVQDKDIWLENADTISREKWHDVVRPIVVDFRPVVSSIEGSLDAKESVRRWKLNPDFGCRYPVGRFKRLPILLMSQETAS
jgi:hypothetical protein